MNQSLWRILTAVNVVLMLAICGVSVFLGGCDSQLELANGNTTYMKCHWTFVANTVIAVAGVFVGLVGEFAKTDEGRRFTAIALIILYIALSAMPSPLGIGLCANADMACHMAAYFTWGVSVVGIILSIIQVVKANPDSQSKPKMQL